QRASVGVECGLPELMGVHLAETLVALQREAFARGIGHGLEQADRPVDRALLVLASQRGRTRIGLLQRRRMLVELARVGRAEQRLIENRNLLDPAHRALEAEAFGFRELALPAALRLFRQRVEAARDVFRGFGGL